MLVIGRNLLFQTTAKNTLSEMTIVENTQDLCLKFDEESTMNSPVKSKSHQNEEASDSGEQDPKTGASSSESKVKSKSEKHSASSDASKTPSSSTRDSKLTGTGSACKTPSSSNSTSSNKSKRVESDSKSSTLTENAPKTPGLENESSKKATLTSKTPGVGSASKPPRRVALITLASPKAKKTLIKTSSEEVVAKVFSQKNI